MGEQRARTILWTVRIALVLALAFSVAFPDLPQFEGKGMAFRAPFFLLPMAAVPIGWRLRGRHEPYPYIADALVISPFLADTLGNAFNFYNSFAVTDDVLHFLNWVLLVAGITLLLLRTRIPPAGGVGAGLRHRRAGDHLVGSCRVAGPGAGNGRARADLRRHDRRSGDLEHRRRDRSRPGGLGLAAPRR